MILTHQREGDTMKTCFHTGSYIRYPIEEAMNRIASFGYQGIEVSAWSDGATFFPDLLTNERIQWVIDKAQDLKLGIAGYDCELLLILGWNLVSTSQVVRERTVEYIKSSVLVAQKLGARFVTISGGRKLYGIKKQVAWQWLVEGLKESVRFSEDHNVVLAIEPLVRIEGDVVNTLEDTLQIIEEVGSTNLGVNLDTGHANITNESLTDYVLLLGNKLINVHLDDNYGKNEDHLCPGMGTMEYGSFFDSLIRNKYEGYLSVEPSLLEYSTDPDKAAFLGMEFFEKFLNNSK